MSTGENEEYGIVYVLKNQWMPGLLKIGMTTRSELRSRLDELYTTGVPERFIAVHASKVRKEDVKKVERALHKAFDPDRVNPKREFFHITDEDRVLAILDVIEIEDVTEDATDILNSGATPSELEAIVRTKERKDREEMEKRQKKPTLNFYDLGIKENEHLYFKEDKSKFVTVLNDKKVVYDGEIYSLTAVTMKLKGLSYAIQPSPFWIYEGKRLIDIYNEKYPLTDQE